MKVLLLSDIHGNKTAFQAVLDQAAKFPSIAACINLGDIIDYGMHSNEVIEMARHLPYQMICNIRGNHEDAIIREDYSRFSSERGRESARYTRSILTQESWDYIRNEMTDSGKQEFTLAGKRCLAVHGSLADEYWTSLKPEEALAEYSGYDYVFSGHSHQPFLVERFYPCEDARRRNKKKVTFINPGSVGQPRNLSSMAQFVVLDVESEEVSFEKVKYDIAEEQAAYHGQVDDFYRERLKWGV